MFTYFDHLECSACLQTYGPATLINLCACGAPVLARYRLEDAAEALIATASRHSLWRYHAMLPVQSPDRIVSLGEGMTPLLRAERLGKQLGLKHLYIKDEALNPTGSFKARGLALAVARAAELCGAWRFPRRATPVVPRQPTRPALGWKPTCLCRAMCHRPLLPSARSTAPMWNSSMASSPMPANGSQRVVKRMGGSISRRSKNRIVSKAKTMGYEIAEQLDWELPNVIVYPTGGGTGLIGMWKSFDEMEALGWLDYRPRLVAVQAAGCAPIVRAFQRGDTRAEPWQNATTMAAGLRCQAPSAMPSCCALCVTALALP